MVEKKFGVRATYKIYIRHNYNMHKKIRNKSNIWVGIRETLKFRLNYNIPIRNKGYDPLKLIKVAEKWPWKIIWATKAKYGYATKDSVNSSMKRLRSSLFRLCLLAACSTRQNR